MDIFFGWFKPREIAFYLHPESRELVFDKKKMIARVDSLKIRPKKGIPVPPLDPNNVSDPFSKPEYVSRFKSLESLDLSHFPLYSSICSIRTLTKLVLRHDNFPHAQDIILAMLGGNRSLQVVELHIGFNQKPEDMKFKGRQIELNLLESFSVRGRRPEDVEELISLISRIPFPKDALVDVGISTNEFGWLGLAGALSSIEHFTHRPTRLRVDYLRHCFEFPGPYNSKIRVSYVPDSEITSALTGGPLPFFGAVDNLHLALDFRTKSSTSLEPSLFPSLEILTIETGHQISTTLSTLLSSQQPPSLSYIKVWNVRFDRDPMERLKRFASAYKHGTSSCPESVTLRRRLGRWQGSERFMTRSDGASPRSLQSWAATWRKQLNIPRNLLDTRIATLSANIRKQLYQDWQDKGPKTPID